MLKVQGSAWLAAVQRLELNVEPVGADVALRATTYGADVSGDPADRLIVGSAQIQGAKLVTADRQLRSVKVIDTL